MKHKCLVLSNFFMQIITAVIILLHFYGLFIVHETKSITITAVIILLHFYVLFVVHETKSITITAVIILLHFYVLFVVHETKSITDVLYNSKHKHKLSSTSNRYWSTNFSYNAVCRIMDTINFSWPLEVSTRRMHDTNFIFWTRCSNTLHHPRIFNSFVLG